MNKILSNTNKVCEIILTLSILLFVPLSIIGQVKTNTPKTTVEVSAKDAMIYYIDDVKSNESKLKQKFGGVKPYFIIIRDEKKGKVMYLYTSHKTYKKSKFYKPKKERATRRGILPRKIVNKKDSIWCFTENGWKKIPMTQKTKIKK